MTKKILLTNFTYIMKKLLSIGFVPLLLMSMTMVMVPVSAEHPVQAIWVEPTLPDPAVDTLTRGDTFTVYVKVNVTNMDVFQFKLYWDRAYVNGTSFSYSMPPEWTNPYVLPSDPAQRFRWDFNATHGRVFLAALNTPDINVTGVFTLATITFHVETIVYEPDPPIVGILNLDDTIIFVGGNPVAHTATDGEYRICPLPVPEPQLRLSPYLVNFVVYGQLFNVSIEIGNLDVQRDFLGWEAKVAFNQTHLTGINSYNGTFLHGFAGSDGTYYNVLINNTLGIIHTAGGFLGSHTKPYTGPGEWGQLAALEFNASFHTWAPNFQFSWLYLYDTKLIGRFKNGTQYYVPHTVVQNTLYNVPYWVLGVGGIYIPVNKLELLAPYIGLTTLLAVAVVTVVFFKYKKKKP